MDQKRPGMDWKVGGCDKGSEVYKLHYRRVWQTVTESGGYAIFQDYERMGSQAFQVDK
jgi:hypothetical protein